MTSDRSSGLLSPALMGRLERMALATRRPLAGALAGEHRSPRHGSSLDFADFREYYPGDDLRRIDVAALARLDRLLIKLFEAEDELSLRLVIDTSASMEGVKLDRAKEFAAALGFSALVRRDIVTVYSFPVEQPGPRFRGRGAAPSFFGHLERLSASGVTPLETAANRVLAQTGPPGLTIVISDLLTADWQRGLQRLPARRGSFAVVHLLDPIDLDPSLDPQLSGDRELVDGETGERLEVSLSDRVLRDFRAKAEAWADTVADDVRGKGGAYLRAFTTDDLTAVLLGRAREAGILR